MIATALVSLVGILVFLFLFWRRLKEDYLSSTIFSSGFYIIFGIAAAATAVDHFFPFWWFWGALVGGAIGLEVAVWRFKLRFYEVFEAASLSLLPWLGLFYLTDAVLTSSPFSLALFLFVSSILVLSYYLSRTYKDFSWYKSGKIGFVGLLCSGLFFLLRAVLALLFPFMLSFVERFEVGLSGIVAFVFFLLLFNLSRI